MRQPPSRVAVIIGSNTYIIGGVVAAMVVRLVEHRENIPASGKGRVVLHRDGASVTLDIGNQEKAA